ncbi:MAG: hypothetical protein RBU37_04205, partial [Myxococcota bacterium]|nr:hypothetical protein [Myxococcota bacterium]
ACGDGIDNDCDAAIDCEDSDCASFPACRESVCNDSIDNDGDGDADCLDSDCNGQSCGPNGRTCASNTCSCPGGSVENACMDGADNDCDGNADCADSDCSNTPACNPVSCEFDTVLLCGYQIEASTIGESNGVSSYSCHSHNSSGGEFIINYLASTNSTVELSLTDMSADLDLMVMPLLSTPQPDCSPNDCDDYSAATGSTQESITFNATAGRLYAFAVDGKNGASSDFTFTIVCSGGTGCAVADYVSCGDTDAWNNYSAGSTNNIDTYDSSCTGTSMTGPEYTYLFYADVDGTLDVEVSGLDSDLDVFIMPFNGGVCDNSISCIGKNTAAGTSNFTASATIEADNLYYVVFDGWGGAESDYNVSFNCR